MRLVVLFGMASAVLAQSGFEVASVKPLASFVPGSRSEQIVVRPGSLTMKSVRLRTAIRWAYDVQDFQISGPTWMGRIEMYGPNIDRFEIVAKAPESTALPEMKRMLQGLLAERFALAVHRENREVPAYDLVVAGNTSALKASDDQSAAMRLASTPSEMAFYGATMAEFGEFIAARLHTPIIDRTGLKGRFDFVMRWSAELTTEEYVAALPEMARTQFGLDLKRRREPVEFLIIDHADKKPIGN